MAWLLTWNYSSSAPSYQRAFVPTIDPVLRARTTLGMQLTAQEIDNIPRTIRVDLRNGLMPPDIIYFSGKLLVLSERVHSALCGLGEKNVASIPVDVTVLEDLYKYHLMHSPPHIDCFIGQETHFPLGYPHPRNNARCAMLQSRILGHHLWMAGDKVQTHRHEWFLSDEFAEFIRETTINEVDLQLYCTEQ